MFLTLAAWCTYRYSGFRLIVKLRGFEICPDKAAIPINRVPMKRILLYTQFRLFHQAYKLAWDDGNGAEERGKILNVYGVKMKSDLQRTILELSRQVMWWWRAFPWIRTRTIVHCTLVNHNNINGEELVNPWLTWLKYKNVCWTETLHVHVL